MKLLPAIVFSLIFPLSAPAVELPDLGEAARSTVSEAQEIQLGQEIMRQIRGDKNFLDDPEITAYLNDLGERLASASPDPYRHFDFFAVRDSTINAFALPGGFVGVHTGLISAARNESELAGVLAHEISHVTQNHIARIVDAQKNNTLTTLAALAVAIVAARSDNPQIAQAAVTTAQAMTIQNQLDYTRDHEKEADRVGLQTLDKAGYAPAGMATFFERLQSQGRLYESKAPAYLRTHPLTHERIADLQNRLNETRSRQHQDSVEFVLIRAKVQAEEGEAPDAYKRFQAAVKTAPDAGNLYGLVASALRAGEREQARQAFMRLEKAVASPMVETLGATVALDSGDPEKAVTRLAAALKRYPANRPLTYAYARSLLRAGKPAAAKEFVLPQIRLWADDPLLYRLLAESSHLLGRRAEGHLAEAEAHIRLDQPSLAMEQLRLARQAGDGDFYTLSIVDARLRELREREERERDEREAKRSR